MAKYCGNCGNKLDDNAYICPKCGIVVENDNNSLAKSTSGNNNIDNGGFGWGILGFFIPIAGLIIYLTMKDTKPKTATAAGKGALISTILGCVLTSIVFIILGILFNFFASGM